MSAVCTAPLLESSCSRKPNENEEQWKKELLTWNDSACFFRRLVADRVSHAQDQESLFFQRNRSLDGRHGIPGHGNNYRVTSTQISLKTRAPRPSSCFIYIFDLLRFPLSRRGMSFWNMFHGSAQASQKNTHSTYFWRWNLTRGGTPFVVVGGKGAADFLTWLTPGSSITQVPIYASRGATSSEQQVSKLDLPARCCLDAHQKDDSPW